MSGIFAGQTVDSEKYNRIPSDVAMAGRALNIASDPKTSGIGDLAIKPGQKFTL